MSKYVRIWCVTWQPAKGDPPYSGSIARQYPSLYGDGAMFTIFRKQSDAKRFAVGRRQDSLPSRAVMTEVPHRIAERWGIVR